MLNNIILIFLLKNIIFKKYFIDLFSNKELLEWARHFVPRKLKLNYYKDKGPVYLRSDLERLELKCTSVLKYECLNIPLFKLYACYIIRNSK